jgi:crotonobetainyl-CoA:carnitine CoA-transferase CaiB-like acyl-CoA transferase
MYPSFSHPIRMMSKPQPLPVQFADLAGGSWPAALQIVSALYQRDKLRSTNTSSSSAHNSNHDNETMSSEERLIEVKMASGAHAALVLPLARRSVSGEEVGGGRDFLTETNALYGVFPTQCGGHVAVGCLEAHFWSGLCKVTGLEQTPMDSALKDVKVKQKLEASFLTQSASYWEENLFKIGVPVTKILSPEEGSANLEKLTGDKMTVNVEIVNHKDNDKTKSRHTLALPKMPLSIGSPSAQAAPKLGCDNDEFIVKK